MEPDQTADRLRQLLEDRALRPQQLAQAIGQTPSAVSHYLSGRKKMNAATLARVAAFLGSTVDWLMLGKGPRPNVVPASGLPMQAADWRMRAGYSDGAKELTNAAWLVFTAEIRAIVREMLQNARDARIDGGLVKVIIRLHSVFGDRLATFRNALAWDSLEPHVEAGAAQDRTLGRTLKRGLKSMRKGPLLVATFNDYNTVGLIGSEFGSGDPSDSNRENFSGLVRHTGDSQKNNAGSGGSFGVGKNTALLASQIRAAVYNSTLSEPCDGKRLNRLIGRTDLGWRMVGDQDYAGPGWFGSPDGGKSKVVSLWNDRTRLHDLFLERDDDETGTSVLIPAFQDPSGVDASMDELAAQIIAAVAKDFWPTIVRNELSVTVQTYENDVLVSSVVVDPEASRPQAVAMLRAYETGAVSETFENADDVVIRRLALTIPKRTNENKRASVASTDHSPILLISRVPEGDRGDDVNRVAAFRNPGMIVEERRYSNVGLTAMRFRGVLMVGLAGEQAPNGEIAELFFKAAEPPAHDKWTPSAINLNQYYYGGQAALRKLTVAVEEALRDALATARTKGTEGPDSIYRHFLIPGRITLPPPAPQLAPNSVRVLPARWVERDGKQLVEVTVRVPAGKFRLRPLLTCRLEDGGGLRIPTLAISEPTNCKLLQDGDVLVSGANGATASFLLEPDWLAAEIARDYSVLSVDVNQTKVSA